MILDLNRTVSQTERERLEKVQENCDPKENGRRISEGMNAQDLDMLHQSISSNSRSQRRDWRKSNSTKKFQSVRYAYQPKWKSYHSQIRDPEQPGPCIAYIRTQWDLLHQYHFQGKISSSLCLLTTARDTPENIASNTKTKLENVQRNFQFT